MTGTNTDRGSAAAALANGGLEQTIPVAWGMGVRFTDVGPGYAVAEVPFAGNANHFGAMYAGVLFTVGEVLGGALSMATFDMSTYFPLVKSLTIDFLKPATGDITARTALDDALIEELAATADEAGKAEFQLVADLCDADGLLVARTTGTYQIRRLA